MAYSDLTPDVLRDLRLTSGELLQLLDPAGPAAVRDVQFLEKRRWSFFQGPKTLVLYKDAEGLTILEEPFEEFLKRV
ncbi:MAG: hypothetical protein AB7O52_15510 [Planctomycetota bacterium]